MEKKAAGTSEARDSILELSGRLLLFGFPPSPVAVKAIPRSPWWRGIRALGFIGGGVALAVGGSLVPPHAPWVLGALGIGGYLGIRKWGERISILSLRGLCPKCGRGIELREGTPLRQTLSLSCEGCLHNLELVIVPFETSPPGARVSGSGLPGHPSRTGGPPRPRGAE
jgi:hypothetical protein